MLFISLCAYFIKETPSWDVRPGERSAYSGSRTARGLRGPARAPVDKGYWALTSWLSSAAQETGLFASRRGLGTRASGKVPGKSQGRAALPPCAGGVPRFRAGCGLRAPQGCGGAEQGSGACVAQLDAWVTAAPRAAPWRPLGRVLSWALGAPAPDAAPTGHGRQAGSAQQPEAGGLHPCGAIEHARGLLLAYEMTHPSPNDTARAARWAAWSRAMLLLSHPVAAGTGVTE